MARRSKRAPSPVALVGSGKVAEKAMKQHLSDFIEAQDGELLWLIPFSENSGKSLDAAIDFLVEENATYAVISDGTLEDEDLEKYAQDWTELESGDPHEAVIARASEDDTAVGVVILLDEQLDSDLDLVEAAAEAGLTTYDLCAGLQVVELEEADEPEAEDPDEDEASAEPEPADEPEVAAPADIPSEALDAISAGEGDEAVEILKKLSREVLVKIAEGVNLDVPKGTHRKTIATDIVKELLSDGAREKAEPEPEDEPAPKTKPSRKSKPEAAPETPSAPEEDGPVPAPAETGRAAPALSVGASDLILLLRDVTLAQGTAEAKKFLQLLRDEELLG